MEPQPGGADAVRHVRIEEHRWRRCPDDALVAAGREVMRVWDFGVESILKLLLPKRRPL
jgi:hypothetical protein